jgi:Domain of unknown function (DUF4920)
MRARALAVIVASVPVFSFVPACSRGDVPATGTAAATAAPKGSLLIGAPITSPIVPLADIARSPGRYEDRPVATTGKVTAVCQEMGCWMEIQDASGQAHIRMHGHAFFVPKTAAGHIARVQATVIRAKNTGKNEDCDEATSSEGATAKVELDATGIELD